MSRAVTLRTADVSDASALHTFVAAHVEEGHLLPRTLDDVTARAARFIVATRGRRIVGCAELAPLSTRVAEVRSLAVEAGERGGHLGSSLVEELRRRATCGGFEQLCAFTHAPTYFVRMGFSMVPHTWLIEKIVTDCLRCPRFRHCGQYAMVAPLDADTAAVSHVPATTHKEARRS